MTSTLLYVSTTYCTANAFPPQIFWISYVLLFGDSVARAGFGYINVAKVMSCGVKFTLPGGFQTVTISLSVLSEFPWRVISPVSFIARSISRNKRTYRFHCIETLNRHRLSVLGVGRLVNHFERNRVTPSPLYRSSFDSVGAKNNKFFPSLSLGDRNPSGSLSSNRSVAI